MKRSVDSQFEFTTAERKSAGGPRAVLKARRVLNSSAPSAAERASTQNFSFSSSAASLSSAATDLAALSISSTALTPEKFRRRFRELGVSLAEALPQFSLDLVALVSQFLDYGHAAAGGKLLVVLAIGPTPLSAHERGLWNANDCRGVACAPNGDIWVSSPDKVAVFDSDGLFKFAVPDFHRPRGIAFSCDNEAFIASTFDDSVFVCLTNGKPQKNFPYVEKPLACAVDSKTGLLFVPDRENSRIAVLNKNDGSHVRSITFDSNCQPVDLAVAPSGELFVHFPYSHTVEIFSQQGESLWSFRAADKNVSSDYDSNTPSNGMCLDRDGNTLIVEGISPELRIYGPNGAFITSCLIEGTELPAARSAPAPAVSVPTPTAPKPQTGTTAPTEAVDAEVKAAALGEGHGFAEAHAHHTRMSVTVADQKLQAFFEKEARPLGQVCVAKCVSVAASPDGKIYIAHSNRSAKHSGVGVFAFEA